MLFRSIAGYFERYPGIRRYIDTIKEEARRTGSVTTQLGRRRPIPELRAGNPESFPLSEGSNPP